MEPTFPPNLLTLWLTKSARLIICEQEVQPIQIVNKEVSKEENSDAGQFKN